MCVRQLTLDYIVMQMRKKLAVKRWESYGDDGDEKVTKKKELMSSTMAVHVRYNS